MSDEQNSGTAVPPTPPAPGGAFDWLRESHQQSAPMAPLTDDYPAPVPAPVSSTPNYYTPSPIDPPPAAPVPAVEPPVTVLPPVVAAPPLQAPPPAPTQAPSAGAAPFGLPPVQFTPPPVQYTPAPPPPVAPPQSTVQQPPIQQPPAQQAAPFSFAAEPLAPSTFGAGAGSSPLTLERSSGRSRSGNSPFDWIAFVLAFLAPPIGLILGIVAAITGSRSRGYAASIAKAAIGIGAALTLVLAVAVVVGSKVAGDQAAHDAIAASSVTYCAKLKANPDVLSSDTFGWPAPGDTIPKSITAIKSYQSFWAGLVAVAPAGIRADTQKFADTAKSIESSVQSTQTLNDANNQAQLHNLVQTTGITTWVSTYCK